jgi:hypothetical protein
MVDPVTVDGPRLTTRYFAVRSMPWATGLIGPVRFEFTPEIHGLGYSLVHVAIPDMGLRARLLVLATPTDGTHVDLRLGLRLGRISRSASVHSLARFVPRKVLESLIARVVLSSFAADASDDFPIWENKAYVERPGLAVGDGPITVYRRWAAQFYSTPTSDGNGFSIVLDARSPAPVAPVPPR